MEEEARGEDSSSPSGKHCISSIHSTGTAADTVRVIFSGGFSFYIPGRFLEERDLHSGSLIDEEDYQLIVSLDHYYRGYRWALDILSNRDYSAYNMKIKLKKRGYPEEVCAKIVSNLEDAGYIDDRRYAENCVYSIQSRKPESRVKLRARLMEKGISREIIEEAVGTVTEKDETEALEYQGRKLMNKRGMTESRLYASLSRRGFRNEMIRRFIEVNIKNNIN